RQERTARIEAARIEAARIEAARIEAARIEAARSEAARRRIRIHEEALSPRRRESSCFVRACWSLTEPLRSVNGRRFDAPRAFPKLSSAHDDSRRSDGCVPNVEGKRRRVYAVRSTRAVGRRRGGGRRR